MMKRMGEILVLLLAAAFFLQGCGDKEEADAMAKWAAFQAKQTETIQAEYGEEALKPHDFESEFFEVEDLPYRFKGLIRFKRGNILQEQSYAFVDGSWTAVKYVDPEDKKAVKKRQQEIERLEKEIRELKKGIEQDEKDLLAHKKRLEGLEAKKTKVQTLQATLEELKGNM